MKDLVLVTLALAAIAGGIWKFYWIPNQEKEKAEISQRLKTEEDSKQAEEKKKPEPAKKIEAENNTKVEDTKADTSDLTQKLAKLEKSYNQKQEELKKVKIEANKYSLTLADWDKKSLQDIETIKEYQDMAIKARDAMIETAKVVATKKQALTLAQNEQRKESGQLRNARTVKEAIGWRYMSEPAGTCHKLPVPTKNTTGPTMLVYKKDTRAQDAQELVQKKIDGINKELAAAEAQYKGFKTETLRIKDEYKEAIEVKLAEIKSNIEKLNTELKEIKHDIDANKTVATN
jgi:DNA repair exonuclease SbcCD ATPase subunit